MSSRRTTYQVASILLLSAGVAAGQTEQTPSTEAPAPPGAVGLEPPPASAVAPEGEGSQEEQQIVIHRIALTRRKDLTTPAPVTVITRQEFQQSGKLTIGDFLQTLPEQGNARTSNSTTGRDVQRRRQHARQSAQPGVTRTLVLINGRRVVPAGVELPQRST